MVISSAPQVCRFLSDRRVLPQQARTTPFPCPEKNRARNIRSLLCGRLFFRRRSRRLPACGAVRVGFVKNAAGIALYAARTRAARAYFIRLAGLSSKSAAAVPGLLDQGKTWAYENGTFSIYASSRRISSSVSPGKPTRMSAPRPMTGQCSARAATAFVSIRPVQ